MALNSRNALSWGSEGFEKCFQHLQNYLKKYGSKDECNELIERQNQFGDIKKDERNGVEESESLNRRKNRLNKSLLAFIDDLRSKIEFSDSEREPLRIRSEWDANGNIVTFFQFEIGTDLNRLFLKLTTDRKWKGLIREERRYILEDGDFGSIIPDYIEESELRLNNIDYSVFDCKTDNEVWFDLKSPEGFVISSLLVEHFQDEFQIWITANGYANERCEMINELIYWIEQQVKRMNISEYSLCLPKAKGFLAKLPDVQEELEVSHIFIQTTQPILEFT